MRGQLDQIRPVIERFDVHAWWQDALSPDLFDPTMNALDGGQRIAPIAHEHDAFHDVRLPVPAYQTQAWGCTHRHLGHVTYANRYAFLLSHGDLLDVVHRPDEPDAPHIKRLLAQGQALAAHVLVSVGDGRLQLSQADIETP